MSPKSKVPTTKLIPVEDRVVAQRIKADTESAGGIIIPEIGKNKPNKALVLRAGPGRWSDTLKDRVPMQVKRGDIIVFGVYDGVETEVDGEKIVVIRGQDILAVLEQEDDEE